MAESRNRGIVLMNLGSPDSTNVKDVRKYLNEFLMDERVIDLPYLLRLLLVRGIISPLRAPKSAHAYQTIWTNEGSPLIVMSKNLQWALQQKLTEPVALAMRYGNPSVKDAFDHLIKTYPDMEEVIAIPLYPHYAMSSYETAVEYAKEIHIKNSYPFKLNFIKPYYDNAAYIAALSEHIKPYLQKKYDHLLFSYHGIPERHIKKTDCTGAHCLTVENCCNIASPAHATCYRHQCLQTMHLVMEQLQVPKNKYSFSFQSRLGRDPWLKPYTDFRLKDMPTEGIKNLLVICPAFVSDCLETLEEIAIRGKEDFMAAGGETYEMIPCLNIHPLWVAAIAEWINAHTLGNKEMVLI